MIFIFIGLMLLLLLLFFIIFIELQLLVVYDQDEGQIRIHWQCLGIIQGQHSVAAKGIQYTLAWPPGKDFCKFGLGQSLHTLKRFHGYLKYVNINELRWYTVIGTGDAMYTALSVGSLWSVKGMLMAGMTKAAITEKVAINIQPDFEKQRMYSELNCIFKLRMVHIILIGVHIICLKIRRYMNGYTAAGKPQPSH